MHDATRAPPRATMRAEVDAPAKSPRTDHPRLPATVILLGVTSLSQLGPQYLRPGELVSLPHEMSTWPNLVGERLV